MPQKSEIRQLQCSIIDDNQIMFSSVYHDKGKQSSNTQIGYAKIIPDFSKNFISFSLCSLQFPLLWNKFLITIWELCLWSWKMKQYKKKKSYGKVGSFRRILCLFWLETAQWTKLIRYAYTIHLGQFLSFRALKMHF